MDIITTVFRVVRNYDMHELVKLEFIKVKPSLPCSFNRCPSSAHTLWQLLKGCLMATPMHTDCRAQIKWPVPLKVWLSMGMPSTIAQGHNQTLLGRQWGTFLLRCVCRQPNTLLAGSQQD